MFFKIFFKNFIQKRCIYHSNRNFYDQKLLPIPAELVEVFDKTIIGQDSAKKKLSVAIYNHYLQVARNEQGIISIISINIRF